MALALIASIVWTINAYRAALIDLRLAITLVIVEGPIDLAIAWIVSRLLEQPEELARRFAEAKQKLEDEAKIRVEKQQQRLVHYSELEPIFSSWSDFIQEVGVGCRRSLECPSRHDSLCLERLTWL
jgi:hypothetical protein